MQTPETVVKTYDDIRVGDESSFACTITEKLVEEFAKLSGDYSPLHMDEGYANTTPFKGRIAHGMLAGIFFSRLIGMHLPGLHSVYLSQTLQFKHPAHLGARVNITGKVSAKSDATKTITLQMHMTDVDSDTLLTSGEALVQVLK